MKVISVACTYVVKGKAVTHHTYTGQGERKYRCYTFMTSVLDGGEWSVSHPGHALPLGKGPLVHIVQVAGWAPEPI